ncbi:putative quinol monooxygenase [Rothia aerolata]|uniref:ABM domain-containing protein n=1 Tax=Rothia aerolata TaxID=1812262 RepID=A0A917IVU3_9MICC|nr:putative quinol monooxygenase [Rothia aerolata]GGH64642.1 hypothetical protein GCM10007359_17100 [Rothia aerolata]
MIGVYAVIPVKPEYAQAWESIAQRLVQDTVAHDEGCVFYDFGKRVDGPEGEYAFLERWMTREALDAHMAAEHHVRANEEWAEYLAGEPEVRIYDYEH